MGIFQNISEKLSAWRSPAPVPQQPVQRLTSQPVNGGHDVHPHNPQASVYPGAYPGGQPPGYPGLPYQGTKPAGGKSWGGLSSYYKFLVIDHYARRMNTRAALDESLEARTILTRDKDSIIGNGLKYDPTPDFGILGKTREQAEAWAEDVKNRFHLWAKSKGSDLTGTNNFYQNQRFIRWQQGRDGEYFIRLHYSKDPALLNPLRISFIDPNQVRGDEFTTNLGPVTQNDGIIKNDDGEEIGYKVWIADPTTPGRFKDIEIPAKDKKTGRPLMIHGYDPEWVGQTRGLSELSYGLQDFEKMTTYDLATIEKMINSSNLGFTVQNDLQDPSDMALPQLDDDGIDVAGITDLSVATTVTTGVNEVTHRQIPSNSVRESGTYNVFGGRQGDKLTAITSQGPAENANEYISGKQARQAAAVSMPPSIASMKFDKSHAASRGELGLYADVKEIKQDDIASDALDIIIEAWLSGEIAAGRIQAPGWADPILKAAWLLGVWIGKPLPDIDPLKTMQAKEKAIELAFSDLDRESVLYNGSSGKANRAKLARQILELTPLPGSKADTSETDDGEPDDDNPDTGDNNED